MKTQLLLCVVLLSTAVLVDCKKSDYGNSGGDNPPAGKKWMVTTLAGNGIAALANGPVLSASFNTPIDIAMAPDGTLYVTDGENNRIRKIKDGQVSNFAGSGLGGSVNGNGETAQFLYPYSIAVDANGIIYTSDINPRIRKISPVAEVSTFAGTLIAGFADGDADTARFYPGSTLTLDAPGNIYSDDVYNCRIRKISLTGKVNTIAGNGNVGFKDGPAADAEFHFPGGIAIDPQNNIYVADRGNYRIRKISNDGQVSTLAGNGSLGTDDGTGENARFLQLSDIVVDKNGNLFITDNHRIRKISVDGVVTTIAGNVNAGYRDGIGDSARFNFVTGLAIDPQGTIYAADALNNRIRKLSLE